MNRRLLLCAMMAVFLATTPAFAVLPDEMLANAELETRARDLSAELRCLVCQNQSIDDSNAPLARDLRILIRERLLAGDTDDEVIEFVVARYGEFVLLRPRVAPHTLVLWFAPAAILLSGAIAALIFVRRRTMPAGRDNPPPLDDTERERLSALLSEDDR